MKKSIIARAIDVVLRRKEVSVEGGFEMLKGQIGSGLSTTKMLERYGKSLYVFACVSKIARKVGAIPVEMYRVVSSKGDVKKIDAHPALDLLYKPNHLQTKNEFIQITVINLQCTGDAFWFKLRNDSGQVAEMWNLRPDWVTILKDPQKIVKGYRFSKEDGTQVVFMPEDVVHFKYPNPLSPESGMSPLGAAEKRVETEEFATTYQRDFFLNSARPDAIIKSPELMLTQDQKEDIREGWNLRYRGVRNSSKIAVLEAGLEYQQIALSQKEMDYIESLKSTRDDILVAFGMPKSVIGITEDVNRANAETGMFIFLSEVVKPCLDFIYEKANEEMVIPDFGEEYYYQPEDPTPANRDMQLKEYSEGLANKYLLINEVRAKEGYAPVRGGWSLYQSITNAPFGGLSSEDQKAKAAVLMGVHEKENEARYLENMKSNGKKFDFSGRPMLKIKLEMREAMESVKSMGRKDDQKKKPWRPYLTDPDMRKAYAQMINKKIDAKTLELKDATDAFAGGQERRVQNEMSKLKDASSLGSKKGRTKKIEVNVEQIFNADKEAKLAVEFISPYLLGFLEESGSDAIDMTSPQENFLTTKEIEKWIRKRAQLFAESVNSTTLEGLEKTLAEGISAAEGIADLRKRVQEVYKGFPEYRSEMIARTEATAANNEGLLQGFKQSGVVNGKEWMNAGDTRVREAHMDQPIGVGGEIVGLDGAFSNGLSYPQEYNCRCVLGAAFLED